MRKKLFGANLKTQFTVINTVYIAVFFMILSVIGIVSISNWRKNDLKSEMFYELSRKNSYALKNSGICIQITENIVNNQRMLEYLSLIASGNYNDVLDILNFYRTEIKSLERLINSNPVISHIRIYIDSDVSLEMMPVIFRLSRASRLAWFTEELSENGKWFFNYADDKSNSAVYSNDYNQAAFVTRVKLDTDSCVVLEVAAPMDDLLSDLYWSNPGRLLIFVDESNNIHHEMTDEFTGVSYEALAQQIDFSASGYQCVTSNINGLPAMIGYLPLEGIPGGLIQLQSLKPTHDYVRMMLLILIAAVIFATFLCYRFISWTVSKVLHDFYVTVDGVKQIQQGNWDIIIPDLGQSEMSELGKQINIMLERIKTLMNESIKKEVIVRDSQLHALQNQINAHFLYNVLETIKMMAVIERKYNVSDAITTLGELMRYNLNWKNDNATLEEEIGYIKNYLSLINLRTENAINLAVNVPDGLFNILIPRMTLQPIIENSITHGLAENDNDTSVYIKAVIHEGTVSIEISDMGNGMDTEKLKSLRERIYCKELYNTNGGNGIGLKNIHDRIQLLYGGNYGLEVESELGWFTKVILKIPIYERPEAK